jgi:precorrin-2/cobalt-factor-2 C20-methyltransferase
VNTVQKCDVIAVPVIGSGERTAFSIIEKYLAGKELLECRFAVEHDMAKRREARQLVAANIMKFLDDGKDMGFITLGDPTTYSTYMYIHEIIVGRGIEAEIIPGITSYAAAAAAFGIALCEGSETLTIIPASYDVNNIDELLDRTGNKVIMKSSENLAQVLEKIKQRPYGQIKIASRCTMEGQRLFNSIDDFEKSPEGGYFTIAIVKEKS